VIPITSDPSNDARYDRYPTDDQNEPRCGGDGKGKYYYGDAYRDEDERPVA
jgi:hypothetical protein